MSFRREKTILNVPFSSLTIHNMYVLYGSSEIHSKRVILIILAMHFFENLFNLTVCGIFGRS